MGKKMKGTFLMRFLKNFHEDEFFELEKYAVYRGQKGAILRGIQLLRGSAGREMSLEEFWRRCGAGVEREFSKKRLSKLCHRIRELALEYVATKEAIQNSLSKNLNAFRYVVGAGWEEEIPGMHRRLSKMLDRIPDQRARFDFRVELAEARHAFQIRNKNASSLQNLERSWESVENQFLVNGLRYENLHLDLLLQEGRQVPEEGKTPRLYRSEWLEKLPMSRHPLIACHRAIWKMLVWPASKALFEEARYLVEDTMEKGGIGREDAMEILQLLLNHAIRRCQMGLEKWATATELQMKLVGEVEGDIHPRELKNAISSLVLYKDAKAAREVFERFKDKIKGDDRGHARTYNEGVVLYFEGRLREAQEKFAHVLYSTEDNYLKSDGRIYWWRAQIDRVQNGAPYDEGHFLYQSQNAKKYFTRTPDLSESARSFYLHYFNVIRKIYKAMGTKGGKKRALVIRIKQEMGRLEDHPLKNWMKEKVEALDA